MLEQSYAFHSARDLVETLEAVPYSKRHLIRKVTIKFPVLTMRISGSEVDHCRKRLTLDEVMGLISGLQLELLIVDQREATIKFQPLSTNEELLDYWRMLNGLFSTADGWKELHFYPSTAMVQALNAAGARGPAGEQPVTKWNSLIRSRDGEYSNASVRLLSDAELSFSSSSSGLPGSKFENPTKSESFRTKPEDLKEEGNAIGTIGARFKSESVAVKDEAAARFGTPHRFGSQSTTKLPEAKDEDDDDWDKPLFAKIPKRETSTAPKKRKLEAESKLETKTTQTWLIIAKRADQRECPTKHVDFPQAAINATNVLLPQRSKVLSWKRIVDAEEVSEDRASVNPNMSIPETRSLHSRVRDVMRVMMGFEGLDLAGESKKTKK